MTLVLDQATGKLKLTVDGQRHRRHDIDLIMHRIGQLGDEVFTRRRPKPSTSPAAAASTSTTAPGPAKAAWWRWRSTTTAMAPSTARQLTDQN